MQQTPGQVGLCQTRRLIGLIAQAWYAETRLVAEPQLKQEFSPQLRDRLRMFKLVHNAEADRQFV